MKYRKNFLDILKNGSSDGIVWTADLAYWIAGREQDGTADPAWHTEEGYVKLCRELEVMPYYFYGKDFSSFWAASPAYSGSVRMRSTSTGHTQTTSWTSPMGEITQITEYLPGSCSTAARKYAVQTESDLEVLLYILENRTLVPAALEQYQGRMLHGKNMTVYL